MNNLNDLWRLSLSHFISNSHTAFCLFAHPSLSSPVMRHQGSLKVMLNTKLWPHTQLKRPARRILQLTATDLESHAIRVFLIQAGARDISRLHAAIHHRLVGMHCRAGLRGRGGSSEDEVEDERRACQKNTEESWWASFVYAFVFLFTSLTP